MVNYKLAKYRQKVSAFIVARKFIATVLAVLLCYASSGNALDDRLKVIEQYPDRVNERADGALQFTLIKGDYINNGARAFVREVLPSTLKSKEWVYYRFAIDISNGWPVEKNQDALVMQWKNCSGSPKMSLHLIGDEFYIKKSGDPVKKWYFNANTASENEFKITAKWAEDGDGEFILEMNGRQVLDYKGQNLFVCDKDPYAAFGLYRPQWNSAATSPRESMSLVFSNFEFGRLGESPELAEPPASPVKSPTAPIVPSAATYELVYSLSSNRSNPMPLEGARLDGKVYVFVRPETGIDQALFYIDPTNNKLENVAPYDLAGGTKRRANPFDMSKLSVGPHTMVLGVKTSEGTEIGSASFSRK